MFCFSDYFYRRTLAFSCKQLAVSATLTHPSKKKVKPVYRYTHHQPKLLFSSPYHQATRTYTQQSNDLLSSFPYPIRSRLPPRKLYTRTFLASFPVRIFHFSFARLWVDEKMSAESNVAARVYVGRGTRKFGYTWGVSRFSADGLKERRIRVAFLFADSPR